MITATFVGPTVSESGSDRNEAYIRAARTWIKLYGKMNRPRRIVLLKDGVPYADFEMPLEFWNALTGGRVGKSKKV